ncbi:MAG: DUF5668 domain-containing protein [Pseudoxanthomonas sp.]|nr:DUF5668 domain-containing protein [Pseudoxanthomonas sp.]
MKRKFVPALVLIVIGVLFLANNLGWTSLDLGQLLGTWWPAILIAVGVGMLLNPKPDKP